MLGLTVWGSVLNLSVSSLLCYPSVQPSAMHTIGIGLRHLGSQGDRQAYQGLLPMRYMHVDAASIPTVCMAQCPIRPRQQVCADKLVARSPVLRDSDVLIVVKGTAFSCLSKKAAKLVSGVMCRKE